MGTAAAIDPLCTNLFNSEVKPYARLVSASVKAYTKITAARAARGHRCAQNDAAERSQGSLLTSEHPIHLQVIGIIKIGLYDRVYRKS